MNIVNARFHVEDVGGKTHWLQQCTTMNSYISCLHIFSNNKFGLQTFSYHMLSSTFSLLWNVSKRGSVFWVAPRSQQLAVRWGVEVLLHRYFTRSSCRTWDPEEARKLRGPRPFCWAHDEFRKFFRRSQKGSGISLISCYIFMLNEFDVWMFGSLFFFLGCIWLVYMMIW